MSKDNQPIRQRILLAASKLFGEREYREVPLEEIAEVAGIGKSTIYGHFKSKDLLFFDCLSYRLGNLAQEIAKITTNPDFEAGLMEVTELLLNKSVDTGRMMITICENNNIFKNANQERHKLLHFFKEWLQHLAPLFETGIATGKLRTDLTVGQMILLFERVFGVNLACIAFNEPVFTDKQLYNIVYNALKK